ASSNKQKALRNSPFLVGLLIFQVLLKTLCLQGRYQHLEEISHDQIVLDFFPQQIPFHAQNETLKMHKHFGFASIPLGIAILDFVRKKKNRKDRLTSSFQAGPTCFPDSLYSPSKIKKVLEFFH